MSGPKISVYELTGWAKKVVTGQIRCEQQSIACAEQIEGFIRQVLSYRGELESLISSYSVLESRGITDSATQKNLSALLTKMETQADHIQKCLSDNMPYLSAKYQISEEALSEKKAQLEKLRGLKNEIEALRNELDKAAYDGKQEQLQASKQAQASVAQDLSGYINFDDLTYDVEDNTESDFNCQKQELENHIRTNLHSSLPHELISEIQSSLLALSRITTLDRLRTFEAITVKHLEEEIQNYYNAEAETQNAFSEALTRYRSICSLLDKEPASYTYATTSMESLVAEIERLELLLIKHHEQSYIQECVDDVMSEMGYDLIGSREVTKRSGKRFRNELFTFNEGTAVNVTYSSDGQIAMELGGIAREDRIPSAEETEILTEDMESFCGEFAEFERRLRAKGIVLGNRIALSPPSAEYAAIINVSRYDVDTETQISEISVSEKQRRKATEKKVLRRND